MHTSLTGDELAIGVAAIVVIVCAAWLAVTTLACLGALAFGQRDAAIRIAGFAPPIARRVLQAALVGTTVLMPVAAHAAPPSEPLVLHVGAGGRLTTLPESGASATDPADEIPVVRAPRTTTTTTPPTTPTTATTPTTSTPAPAAPVPSPVSAPAAHRHVVRAGDNLWRIARAEITRVTGASTSDEAVARYWKRVIAANRSTLRSGDPSLIFPGEVIALPLD